MIQNYREQFNSEFSEEKYKELYQKLSDNGQYEVGFRISESPIFLPQDFEEKLNSVSSAIIDQIKQMSSEELQKAIPTDSFVPNDTKQPHFLALDYGICKNEKGEIVPQLIELQAFPSLFSFKKIYEEKLKEVYPFLSKFQPYLPKEEYITLLKKVILGDEKPENVILLEIFPEKQKTLIDFIYTEEYLGIKTVCLTKIRKQGKNLFYDNNGVLTPIKRIYNRIIFDELEQFPDLETEFKFTDEVDVTWVTHPNWFFKVSKYILPKLRHEFIPQSYYLHEFPKENKLEDFVLKPLFSFAGSGVDLYPDQEKIDRIEDKENYIMQRKASYEPLFKDTNGEFSKAEIRLLYLWEENEDTPTLAVNLVRMTKAEMVNVNFNKKDAIWIGSSVGLFGN